jgi:citrate lyase alpha subunit
LVFDYSTGGFFSYKIFQDKDLNFYTRGTYTQTSHGGTLLLVKNYLNPTLIETNVQAELCWINIIKGIPFK